jgi:regulator of nonsense transcripts 2
MPPIHVMDCLQECLNAPSGFNIDVMITILEKTGYYLIHNKDKNDHLRFEMQLTQINNFRTTSHLSDMVLIQLENAYYICKPPERAALKLQKNLSPLENYIHYLLFEKLEDDKIAGELDRLPMKECESFLIHCFLKIVKKGRFGQIDRVSALARYLTRFYPNFGIKLVDATIEEIQRGMEDNIFIERQKRILMMKFFGELYNYTILEIQMIFKILYFLIDAGNDPNDKAYKHIIDPKDDTFRISLICTLLESVAEHLKKKKYKNVIDKYLVFFQRYILSKSYIPMNVEFTVLDVLDSLAPELKKFKSLKEAQEACAKLSKIKDEEESKDLLDLRVNLPEEAPTPTEEDYERERQIRHSKQEKQFDLDLQTMIQESIQENAQSQSTPSRPVKLIKEKGDSNAGGDTNKDKKITLCLRVGNKVIPKNIFLDKESKIAQKITQKEQDEKVIQNEVNLTILGNYGKSSRSCKESPSGGCEER